MRPAVRRTSKAEAGDESSLAELRISWLLRAWQTKTSVNDSIQHQIADYLAARVVRQREVRNKNRRATIPRHGTASRRLVAVNRYSAIVTNRVLPPKWISVILLFSLTNAEYFALPVSSFHCTGASATTFPFIEIRT